MKDFFTAIANFAYVGLLAVGISLLLGLSTTVALQLGVASIVGHILGALALAFTPIRRQKMAHTA